MIFCPCQHCTAPSLCILNDRCGYPDVLASQRTRPFPMEKVVVSSNPGKPIEPINLIEMTDIPVRGVVRSITTINRDCVVYEVFLNGTRQWVATVYFSHDKANRAGGAAFVEAAHHQEAVVKRLMRAGAVGDPRVT